MLYHVEHHVSLNALKLFLHYILDIAKLEHGSRLTLSARCLQVLYEGFRHVQNASCVQMSHTHLEEKFFSSLTHLQDIIQNTKELLVSLEFWMLKYSVCYEDLCMFSVIYLNIGFIKFSSAIISNISLYTVAQVLW